MATYYRRQRREERQRDEPPDAAHTPPLVNTEASILVFPSPPSDLPSTPPDLRRGSTSLSIPTSLISSVEGHSPGTPSDSWDELSSDAAQAAPAEPLTRDRLARLQSGLGWSSDDDVEVWDWSGGQTPASSNPSSVLHGRRPLSRYPPALTATSTEYESASSELHFSTTASSHILSEEDSEFGSLFLLALRSRQAQNKHPDSSSSSSISFSSTKFFHIPFESILRFLFDLDPSTLDLLKRTPRPHPDPSASPSELFPTRIAHQVDSTEEYAATDGSPGIITTPFAGEAHQSIRSVRQGLDALQANNTAPATHRLFVEATRVPRFILQTILRI